MGRCQTPILPLQNPVFQTLNDQLSTHMQHINEMQKKYHVNVPRSRLKIILKSQIYNLIQYPKKKKKKSLMKIKIKSLDLIFFFFWMRNNEFFSENTDLVFQIYERMIFSNENTDLFFFFEMCKNRFFNENTNLVFVEIRKNEILNENTCLVFWRLRENGFFIFYFYFFNENTNIVF